jgi:predicted nucleic acid-binding protein
VSVFFDTSLLVYAQQAGPKGERAADLIARGGVISVQVLNELANVLRKKWRRDWPDVEAVLDDVRDAVDDVLPLSVETHSIALEIARDHGLSFYDALIVASALQAGCETLFSEHMQNGRVFSALTIRNPFVEGAAP